MSYANRGELKQAVRDWLTEESSTVLPDSVIEDAIGFVESDLNWNTWGPQSKTFRVFDMQEVSFTTVISDDVEYIGLPDDFISMRYVVQTSGQSKQTLKYATPEDFVDVQRDSGDSLIYTYSNQQLRVKPSLNTDDTLEMGYYQEVPALADDTSTNWLLEKAPKIYLSGALSHLGVFLDGVQMQERYEAAYVTTVLGMITQDIRRRVGEGPVAYGQHERVA